MQYSTVKSLSEYLKQNCAAEAPAVRAVAPVQEEPIEVQEHPGMSTREADAQKSSDSVQAQIAQAASAGDAIETAAGNVADDRSGKRNEIKPGIEEIEQYLGRLFLFWGHAILSFFQEENILKDRKPVGKDFLKEAIGCSPRYGYLIEVFLDILQRNGLIEIDADTVCLSVNAVSAETQASVKKLNYRMELLTRALPDFSAHLMLFEFCKKHYREILSGKINPDVLLSSPQERELIQYVYNGDHRLADRVNAAFSEHLNRHIENYTGRGQKKIRILEAGAGTLSISNFIFDSLKGKIQKVEYYHADKPLALSRLRQEVGRQAYPFVHFQEIDVDEIGKREKETEKFDIIILRTVLSDTHQLTHALNIMERASKKESLIVIGRPLEGDYLSLTFGLLDEAWSCRYSPSDTHSPESNRQWERDLRSAGFAFEEALGQSLIIAMRAARDGAVQAVPARGRKKNKPDSPEADKNSPAAGGAEPAPAALNDEALLKRRAITTSLGHQLEFYTYGHGEPIVFLTALAFTHTIWKHQIQHFHNQYQLIFPHILPGHAGSAFAGKSFTFEELSEDLAELLDHLGIPSVHLLGWCMAGNVAQLFTFRHPRRVNTLTLVCTTPTDARVRGLDSQDLKTYSVDPLAVYELEFQNIYRQRYYSDKNIRDYLELIRTSSCKVQEEAMLHHMYGVFEFDSTERLGDISVRTMVMSGKWDIAFPPDQVRLLHRGIKHSEFIEFEMAGHMPFLNQHALFNAALEDFLKSSKGNQGIKGLAEISVDR
jgi:3-oxoadipate enol-lactonase